MKRVAYTLGLVLILAAPVLLTLGALAWACEYVIIDIGGVKYRCIKCGDNPNLPAGNCHPM